MATSPGLSMMLRVSKEMLSVVSMVSDCMLTIVLGQFSMGGVLSVQENKIDN